MSKSLGNFLMIKDVLQTYHPETVRLFLLSKQYRKPIDFNRQAMSESASALDRIYKLLLRMKELGDGLLSEAISEETGSHWDRFCEAMDDDFNTARGMAVIFDAVRHANRLLDENTETMSADTAHLLNTFQSDICKMGHVLGILNDNPEDHFNVRKTKAVAEASIDVDTIEQLVKERNAARKARDWHKADQIRDRLLDMNIILEDGPGGTSWKIDT
jgi:cysteinyl-tRNA synthetase